MILRRTILFAVLLPTGLALQTSLLGSFTLTGTKPELLLLVTLSLAIVEGPGFGAVAGFGFGLATDLVLELPAGISALTFTLAGYTVGRVRAHMQTASAWVPIVMVATATFLAVLFYGTFSMLLDAALPITRTLRHSALAAVYNALLTPLVFPAMRVLASATRPSLEVMR